MCQYSIALKKIINISITLTSNILSIRSEMDVLSVTIFYLDSNWCLLQKLLYFIHDVETIYLTIIEKFNYYVIAKRIVAVMLNNVFVNEATIIYIENELDLYSEGNIFH